MTAVRTLHPLRRTRAVLLDVDGTLVDSNEQHVQAWRDAFQSRGHILTAEQIRPHIGKGGDKLVPALLSRSEKQEREAIAAAHDQVFASHFLDRILGFPGAADFVEYLHVKHYQVVLASSAREHEVKHYIQLLGIEPYLTAITTSDDVSRSKPAPDIFEAALRKVRPTAAASCSVVGDTPYDLMAAAACGMASIALLSGGFAQGELQGQRPRAVYTDVMALWKACEPTDAER